MSTRAFIISQAEDLDTQTLDYASRRGYQRPTIFHDWDAAEGLLLADWAQVVMFTPQLYRSTVVGEPPTRIIECSDAAVGRHRTSGETSWRWLVENANLNAEVTAYRDGYADGFLDGVTLSKPPSSENG